MASPKTVPTKASVDAFIASQPGAERQADCQSLLRLMQRATGEPPVMWGGAIVGFGSYRMGYANGSTGDWPLVAFSPRKNDLTLYLMPGCERFDDLLCRLGKFKTGKVCLYLKRLADVDVQVLGELIEAAVAAMAAQRVQVAA